MSKLNIQTIVAALCGSVFLTACPGDDTGGTGTATEGESTSTGPSVTTMPPPTTNPPDDTTTTGDMTTTVALDDTSTTVGPLDDTTTTGDDTTGTTGDETTGTTGTTDGTESTTDEPPPPAMGYGDCVNFLQDVACLPDEICGNDGNGSSVCLGQGCAADADCIVPPTGDAVPTCFDLTGDMINECYLDCAMGEACPDGMVCVLDFICVWEAETGVCPDQDLGNTVPQTVMGDTAAQGDDWDSTCAPNGVDVTYTFTAAAADTYVFDTIGTVGDTVLAVLDDCAGPEVACNDDVGMGVFTSEVTVDLAAGQSVVIVVEGYGGAPTPFTLNISTM